MGTVSIRALDGGLDARRRPESTPGGALILGRDGHITRGKEYEQRAAFVPVFDLPAKTVDLTAGPLGLVTFGHGLAPTDLPTGVVYQRLQHPSGTALDRVLSAEMFASKIYAVARFVDGTVYHFYDGVIVDDWFDGRARAEFRVLSGPGQVDSVLADEVELLSAPVMWQGAPAATAAAIAAALDGGTTSPDYSASAYGNRVSVAAVDAGKAANGRLLEVTVSGGLVVSPLAAALSGGDDPAGSSAVGSFQIAAKAGPSTANPDPSGSTLALPTFLPSLNGTQLVAAAVPWAGGPKATAAAIVAAINSHSSLVSATALDATVTLVAADMSDTLNGVAPVVTVTLPRNAEPVGNIAAMAGGASSTFVPGAFVKTVRSKLYSTAGPILHFSGLSAPQEWTTDAVGAGFVDVSAEDAAANRLVAVAKYVSSLAVFAERVVLIYYVDPDPALVTLSQTLPNTGTKYPRSVTPFGDSDLFYLDESGLRSLRARDSSNAAASTDVGDPVDRLITAKLLSLPAADAWRVFGVINPVDKRFWLVIKDEIFVLSFYRGSQVSAWTTYSVSTPDLGTLVADAVTVYGGRVYIRCGAHVLCYGGVSGPLAYDATQPLAWLPYLDADRPSAHKKWTGIDVGVAGAWEVSVGTDPSRLDAAVVVANVTESTYGKDRVPFEHASAHASLRFRGTGDGSSGPAILSSAVLHFAGDEDEK